VDQEYTRINNGEGPLLRIPINRQMARSRQDHLGRPIFLAIQTIHSEGKVPLLHLRGILRPCPPPLPPAHQTMEIDHYRDNPQSLVIPYHVPHMDIYKTSRCDSLLHPVPLLRKHQYTRLNLNSCQCIRTRQKAIDSVEYSSDHYSQRAKN